MDNRRPLQGGLLYWGSALVMLTIPVSALALDAEIEGIEGDMADNVEIYLKNLDGSEYSVNRLRAEVMRLTQEAMRVYGYYEPQIEMQFDDEETPEEVALVIDKGEPVRLEVIDFTLAGDAANDEPFQQAIDDYPQQLDDVLLHEPYDSLKGRLQALNIQRGYFDWQFTDERMEIRPWAHSARLYLGIDSGPRYRFGKVAIHGNHILEERLRNLKPFDYGDPYLASEVAEFNNELGSTEWFGSISVRPRLDRQKGALALPEHDSWWSALDVEEIPMPEQGPRINRQALVSATSLYSPEQPYMPIDVVVTPADRHQFETGIGYATDVGPRLQFSWEQPWINRYGHSLDHKLYLSGPDQQFSGTYNIPLDDPLRDSYRLQYGLRNQDIEDTESFESTIDFGRHWVFDNDWEQTIYLRATYEDFTQGNESNQVLLLYPGVQWTRTRTRNPQFPTWGDRQTLNLQYSSEAWGSDAEFFRMTGDTAWIRKWGDDNRFIGRLGVGMIETDDFSNIPPSLRFFTGGDTTVRGYSYESLSPEDENGKLTGGQNLLAGSVEAQRRITGKWWGAVFFDAGDAFTDWWPDEVNKSAGLGVRWISPVGPIRLDLAHPFDDDDNSVRFHFAIGPEF
ncbi:outer membrane protein assembly factor [Halomonas cupida]|uniref:Translocation and assembly module subunit TamA n=1 Tax=Halomonas cupida TaxID=44933 RepID=A0A1M7BA50_9GAMM|nr:autotransporter assembly complex family protein [Halomonas cupida]GEN22085.1 outer membrane protein assembly factor [Halomonas cupida]SHL51862.1 autotransporter secretion outer membrane protein TamA [Halomonas cupida]